MDIVTDAMTAFKMTETDKFCDILAVASSATNTSVDQMGEAFKYCAPVCGGLGITAKDTAVFLGTLANQSIKGSQAGTTLRKGLQNLAKPTKEMTAQMQKYGIELKTTKDGNIDLYAQMVNVRQAMKGLSAEQKEQAIATIFGTTATAGWMAILNNTDEEFEQLTQEIYGCEGAVDQMNAVMRETPEYKMELLNSAIERLKTTLGEQLLPILMPVVDTLTNIINKIADWAEAHPKLAQAIMIVVGVVAVFIGIIASVLSLISYFSINFSFFMAYFIFFLCQ